MLFPDRTRSRNFRAHSFSTIVESSLVPQTDATPAKVKCAVFTCWSPTNETLLMLSIASLSPQVCYAIDSPCVIQNAKDFTMVNPFESPSCLVNGGNTDRESYMTYV